VFNHSDKIVELVNRTTYSTKIHLARLDYGEISC